MSSSLSVSNQAGHVDWKHKHAEDTEARVSKEEGKDGPGSGRLVPMRMQRCLGNPRSPNTTCTKPTFLTRAQTHAPQNTCRPTEATPPRRVEPNSFLFLFLTAGADVGIWRWRKKKSSVRVSWEEEGVPANCQWSAFALRPRCVRSVFVRTTVRVLTFSNPLSQKTQENQAIFYTFESETHD